MSLRDLNPGDIVYAKVDILNEEGAIPTLPEGALIASSGTRGVILNIGHVENNPTQELFLVRFEQQPDLALGPPTGCWAEELTDVAPARAD